MIVYMAVEMPSGWYGRELNTELDMEDLLVFIEEDTAIAVANSREKLEELIKEEINW